MILPPDAAELKALWSGGRPRLPLPPDAGDRVRHGLGAGGHWVARLNAVRLAPFVNWADDERKAVVSLLLAFRDDAHRFVRPWALGAAWRMVSVDDPRRSEVESWLTEALASPSASARARARILLRETNKGR